MRYLAALVAFAAVAVFSGTTFAGEADGTVKKVDTEAQTVTLDDGNTYKIPGEFDISTLQEGMEIVIAYDKVNGQNQITDMQLPDEQ